MARSSHRGLIPVLSAILAAAGCGSGLNTVPVSGSVSLDGKPTPGLLVRFEPLEVDSSAEGWTDSTGITDAEGNFILTTPDGQVGALPGKHMVSVTTANLGGEIDPTTEGAEVPTESLKEPIPAQYNLQSTLTIVVPPGGTKGAHFKLVTK